MTQETDLEVAIAFNAAFDDSAISDAELDLLSAILPEVLEDVAMQTATDRKSTS